MTNDDRIGYGLRDGALLFITDVPRGLGCNCVCANCRRPLVAKKGPVRIHHFAHHRSSICEGAVESVLHSLAKELIAELDSLVVPPYEFIKRRRTKTGAVAEQRSTVAKGGNVRITGVRLEKSEGNFIPDVVIDTGSRSLIVEIAVTHKVTREKLRRIRRRNLPAIEIRLDSQDTFLPREELRLKLQQDLASKVWLFHPKQRDTERKFFAELRALLAHGRTASRQVAIARDALPRPTKSSRSQGMPPFSEYDRTSEDFNRIHGRYPSADECLRLWPNLWKKR